MFPQEFIDRIKEEVNLKDLVEEYTDLKKVGPYTYTGHCPNPNHNDSTPSFRVFLKGYKTSNRVNRYDTWACMGCHNGKKNEESKEKNYGSDCIAFIRWIDPTKRRWKDAVIYLAQKYHIPIPTDENEIFYKHNKIISNSCETNLKGKSLNYLLNRGLSIEDCKEWHLGFDGLKITFPLLDRYKNILGFSRRWLEVPEGSNDKYRNSASSIIFNKSMYLYGIQNLEDDFPEIRITEGPMDVIMAHKYGLKNVVATLGTAFTEGHVEIIKHYDKIPVFIFDGDDAGFKAINRAINLLAAHNIYSKIYILPKDKDLFDYSKEVKFNIEQIISDEAITYGAYLIRDLSGEFLSKLSELQMSYIPKFRNVLNFVPDNKEKLVLNQLLQTTLHLNMDKLY